MRTHEEIQNKLSHSLEVMMLDTETIESFNTLMDTMEVYEELGYSMQKFRETNEEYLGDLELTYRGIWIDSYGTKDGEDGHFVHDC